MGPWLSVEDINSKTDKEILEIDTARVRISAGAAIMRYNERKIEIHLRREHEERAESARLVYKEEKERARLVYKEEKENEDHQVKFARLSAIR